MAEDVDKKIKPKEELFSVDELAKGFEYKTKKGELKKLSFALLAGIKAHYRWPADKKLTKSEFKKLVEEALVLPAHKF